MEAILQKHTQKKVIHIVVVMIPGDVQDGAANQMTEYTWVMKTAEMSSFNAQWEKLFTSLHLTAGEDLRMSQFMRGVQNRSEHLKMRSRPLVSLEYLNEMHLFHLIDMNICV